MYDSIKYDETFDFIFTDNGIVKVVKDAESISNMLVIDFSSNNSWSLDERLGMNWLKKNGTGLLQLKNSDVLLVKEIQSKLENTEGVREVESIGIDDIDGRKTYVSATIVIYDGSTISIDNTVKGGL